jgi:hypothetical protein
MGAAKHPELVDYVVAMDENDLTAVKETHHLKRVISPLEKSNALSTAVRNWNAAASVASGDLLFVISDDLYPPPDWDLRIWSQLKNLDPLQLEYAVKIRDSPSFGDKNLTHPLVSRGFYERFGLFEPSYSHLFVDLDLTLTAFWKRLIIDCRGIEFTHRHPSFSATHEPSVSQVRGNRPLEVEVGNAVFRARWPLVMRATDPMLLNPRKLSQPISVGEFIEIAEKFHFLARVRAVWSLLEYLVLKGAKATYWLLVAQRKAERLKRQPT